MIIFDFGSGNGCKNDLNTARTMIVKLAELNVPDSIIKWQLFKSEGDNIPLDLDVFSDAVRYAQMFGIATTASVFDVQSLDYILNYNVPFIKLANDKNSQKLLSLIPEHKKVIISTDDPDYKTERKNVEIMYCISKYPSDEKDYSKFGEKLSVGLSDHTSNWNLFKKFQPKNYECHFKLEGMTGLDAGKFARTPEMIKEILRMSKPDISTIKEFI